MDIISAATTTQADWKVSILNFDSYMATVITFVKQCDRVKPKQQVDNHTSKRIIAAFLCQYESVEPPSISPVTSLLKADLPFLL